MEIADELGPRLRARRTAAGRTIASVAMEAGLSVPYVANLENGRGNPTIAALRALARALGAQLVVDLDEPASAPVARLPASLRAFARTGRFADEAERLAARSGAPVAATRERLLAAMSGLAAVATGNPGERDWHRILDAVVLMARDGSQTSI